MPQIPRIRRLPPREKAYTDLKCEWIRLREEADPDKFDGMRIWAVHILLEDMEIAKEMHMFTPVTNMYDTEIEMHLKEIERDLWN